MTAVIGEKAGIALFIAFLVFIVYLCIDVYKDYH
jgi:hypothetical protein